MAVRPCCWVHAETMKNNGFTLLELIVVCALIGIMLVVSVPALRNTFVNDRLKSTSRKTIGLINNVRELAMREQQGYIVHFDRARESIWFEQNGETDKTKEIDDKKNLAFPVGVRISEIWTRAQGVFSHDVDTIWVSRKGYMDQLILHLSDDEDNVISLHFSPFLEIVKVYDEYTPDK